jgi:hypothetical protein
MLFLRGTILTYGKNHIPKLTILSLLISAAFTLSATVAWAQAITLRGVNVSLTAQDFKITLSAAGYVCTQDKLPPSLIAFGQSPTRETRCIADEPQGKAMIMLSDDPADPNQQSISFNCVALNSCGYTQEEVAQAIVNSGVVPQLEPKPHLINENWIVYWGRGPSGDEIEIGPLGWPENEKYVILKIGTFKSGGIRLN